MSKVIRILGIDPGLRRCGWGLVDADGARVRFVQCGTITPPAAAPMSERLLAIFSALGGVIARHQPQRAAIEDTFVNANPASALKLGAARAAAMLAPAQAGLAVASYAPRTIKKALVGTGRADKAQMAAMITVLLPGCSARADEADALAVAICAAHHAPALEQAS